MTSQACCKQIANGPVQSDYTPKGSTVTVDGQDVYVVGNTGAPAIVVIYDVFGFFPQTQQMCDRFADAGFSVAMPDVFHGEPWPIDKYPPKTDADWKKLMAWVGSYSYDKIKPEIEALMAHMRQQGSTAFGIFGFCFGGRIMGQALKDPGMFKAGGAVHPGMPTAEDAKLWTVPACLLLSKDEADFAPLKAETDKLSFGSECVYKKYDNMQHGFCAAHGDFSKPDNAAAATDVSNIAIAFFQKHVK